MAAIKRIPKEVHFENNIYDYFSDSSVPDKFDFYLIKSKPNALVFEVEDDCKIKVLTAKFPTGEHGCGYVIDGRIIITGDESNGKCYSSGVGGSRSFKTEFDAQYWMINYILKHCLISSWLCNKMRKELEDFVNPKALF